MLNEPLIAIVPPTTSTSAVGIVASHSAPEKNQVWRRLTRIAVRESVSLCSSISRAAVLVAANALRTPTPWTWSMIIPLSLPSASRFSAKPR